MQKRKQKKYFSYPFWQSRNISDKEKQDEQNHVNCVNVEEGVFTAGVSTVSESVASESDASEKHEAHEPADNV